jgi:hypothetical protein
MMSPTLQSMIQAAGEPIRCGDHELHNLLAEAAQLQIEVAAVTARILEELITRKVATIEQSAEVWLTADQAAVHLGVDARWIRRRARVLPFVRRISGKAIRVSDEGLRRWMAARRAA